MANANHYQVLGIDIQANDAVIRKAYRRVALKNHPDKTLHLSTAEIEQRTQIFKLATTAQEVLLDPAKRKSYNKTLARAVRPSNTPTARPPQARPPPAQPPPAQPPPAQPPPAQPPPAPAPDAPGFKRPPPPRTTSTGTDPFRPPKFHYFGGPREPPSSKATQTPPPPQTPHPFTAGSPAAYPPPTPYFYAPVTGSSQRTTLTYSNNDKWSFSIGVSKKYEWTVRPTLPFLGEETKDMIAVKFCLRQTATTPATVFIRDVVLTVESTPDDRSIAVSSIFAERKDGIDLWITLAGIGR
ncbi:uncharacterized protein J4E79_006605 [Alternaria viburni]|uniref:uncharacterized protein n=1 Tax=Alternaria viburni TaxID=566460 RepID=UPI0020C309FA|nr:uncharacterized protein J4E79_006605 [Alternaria viburni]KAI4658846.1 hypothetical protein J4E79_006605 [Alternaria viburni]